MGIAFAGLGLRVLLAAMPYALPRAENIGLHLPVLLFTLLTSILVGILFSLVPTLQSARPDLQATMRQNARSTTMGRNVLLSRLVTAQFALTLVLMTCAGLLLRSLQRVHAMDLGLDPEGLLTVQVTLPETRYPGVTERRVFFEGLLDRVRGIPGVPRLSTEVSRSALS